MLFSCVLVLASHEVWAANVAHEGFPDPAVVTSILMADGHTVTELSRVDVEVGDLNAGGFDVFIIGHRSTMFGAASAFYVNEVAIFVSGGGNIVTEHTGAAMFFTQYHFNAFPSMTGTPQLEMFDGIVHGGWPHQFNTTITLLDPTHEIATGMPAMFAEGEGTELFTWVDFPDPRLQVVGDFVGIGGRDFRRGALLPCLLLGEEGNSRFVFAMWGYSNSLSRGANNHTFFLNAVRWAASEFNGPPECMLDGPFDVECAGDLTDVALDGTQSTDPNGDALAYLWEVDCPDASFDDPNSPTPILTMMSGGNCSLQCTVTLTVDDGQEATTCSTTVNVRDTTPPQVSCSVETVDEGVLIHFGAADDCSDVTATGSVDLGGGNAMPVEDGQLLTCAELQDSEAPMLVVMAADACGNGDSCSSSIEISCETGPPPVVFVRSDFNANERVSLRDPLLSLRCLFFGRPVPVCWDATDSNDDGQFDLSDPIHTLMFLCGRTPPPPAPFPEAGVDPTEDDLGCEIYPRQRERRVERSDTEKKHIKKNKRKKKRRRRKGRFLRHWR